MLNVWANNASQWGDDSNQFEDIPFHQTTLTQTFLGDDDRRFFVCGLKGVGKTLLLQKKSRRIRTTQTGVIMLPASQLIEKLTPLVTSLSRDLAKELSTQTGWFRIWLFSLAMAIVRRLVEVGLLADDSVPDRLNEVFSHPNATLSYHVDQLLQLPSKERRELLEGYMERIVVLVRSAPSGIAVFVDALEDCVYSHVGPDLARYEDGSATNLGILSAHVWRAAQIGFLRAAVALHELNRHVKVFAALRREALDGEIVTDLQNLLPYLLTLEYSRNDLKEIFRTKLRALRSGSPEQFVSPKDEDVVRAFFGYTNLRHPTVRTIALEPFEEDLLDYIVRHSRGRPRELDILGESLQLISERPRTEEAVRRRVREKSKQWFGWAKTEAIPYWRDELDRILLSVPSNFVTRSEFARICNVGAEPEILKELFDVGLLGCVTAEEDGGYVQRFRQSDPDLPVGPTMFEHASYYVIHPCVNLATRLQKNHYEPDPHNVAGHGYPFVYVSRHYHVHFGLGALGAGLVVPLLSAASGTSIAIIQRKSNKWKRALKAWKGGQCRIVVKGDFEDGVRGAGGLRASAFVGTPTLVELDELVERWRNGAGHLVLITSDPKTIRAFVSIATSVSTAVRELPSMEGIARTVRNVGANVEAIYPFENSEELIRRLQSALAETKATIVQVSADRICKDARVVDGGIVVDAEDYYRVVVSDQSVRSRALFGASDVDERHSVHFESDERRFRWEREAKRLLVNGMHFAYAVFAFRHLYRKFRDQKDVVEFLIDKPVSELLLSPEVVDAMKQIADLYIIHLLIEAERLALFSEKADAEGHYNYLMKLHDTFGSRLATTRDYLKRILSRDPADVAEKFARFTEPLEALARRLSAARVTNSFYGRDLDRARVESDGEAFRAACADLLRYQKPVRER